MEVGSSKDCLGALDRTYVKVSGPLRDQGRYRNIKNEIATNVLGACSRDVKYTCVLPGWEGSATYSRILRHALVRLDPLIVLNEQPNDPFLAKVDDELCGAQPAINDADEMEDDDVIEGNDLNSHGGMNTLIGNRIRIVQPTNHWTQFKNALARAVFIDYQNRRGLVEN